MQLWFFHRHRKRESDTVHLLAENSYCSFNMCARENIEMLGQIDLLIHPEVASGAKTFGFRAISAVKTTQKMCSTASSEATSNFPWI